MRKTAATDAFWNAFRADCAGAPADYRLLWFGDADSDLADRLADLVAKGPKRATATLARDWETGKEPVFPKAGDLWLVVRAGSRPVCVVETTRVEMRAFAEVDAVFAWDEGEGDRTLADWRAGHRRYFNAQAAAEGFTFGEASAVVLERFRVIWPAALADG